MKTRTLEVTRRVDLVLTLAPMRHGPRDPTIKLLPGEVRRASRTPDGPVTVQFLEGGSSICVNAWGPGSEWTVDRAPEIAGLEDDDSTFRPSREPLLGLRRRLSGLRFFKTSMVLETLVPVVLEQKVTSNEAHRSYARLTHSYSERAPGPFDLLLPPDPSVIADVPYFDLHALGIERKRAETLKRVCAAAKRLEEGASLARAEAYKRLTSIPGVGDWSAAETGRIAFGDADAVSLGDYHLPHLVAYAMTGERRGTDSRMLELIEEFRPHRARAVRLIEVGAPRPPRRAPRAPLRRLAAH